MLPRPAWTACMQEAVAGAGIDKQKTLGDGGKGHRSSAPSVTPPASALKPTARPVLHKKKRLAAFSGALAGWRARATSWQVARVRDSESMQRAVWRKNSDTF